MLGSPMPAPKPRERTLSGAVDHPSCMACSTSGMPGLIPASYMAMDTRRIRAGEKPSCFKVRLTAPEASPARVKSSPGTS